MRLPDQELLLCETESELKIAPLDDSSHTTYNFDQVGRFLAPTLFHRGGALDMAILLTG